MGFARLCGFAVQRFNGSMFNVLNACGVSRANAVSNCRTEGQSGCEPVRLLACETVSLPPPIMTNCHLFPDGTTFDKSAA